VTASPALAVRDTGAAALLGVSPGLLRKWRLADRAAVALGRAPQGPPWRSLGGAVVYAVDELQAWLKRQPLGAVAP